MLRRVKTSTLLAICGGLGVAIGGMATLLQRESANYANQVAFVKTALDMIENEPTVLDMIGQPYALGQPKLLDLYSGLDFNNVKVRVSIKGSNDTAFIYAFARKKDPKDKLKLFKIELTFDKIKGKKMILFDVDDKDIQNDIQHKETEPDDGVSNNAKNNEKSVQKKASPVPEGFIPEIDPNKPRRIPKSVLRNRKSNQTNADNKTNSDIGGTDGDNQKPTPN